MLTLTGNRSTAILSAVILTVSIDSTGNVLAIPGEDFGPEHFPLMGDAMAALSDGLGALAE